MPKVCVWEAVPFASNTSNKKAASRLILLTFAHIKGVWKKSVHFVLILSIKRNHVMKSTYIINETLQNFFLWLRWQGIFFSRKYTYIYHFYHFFRKPYINDKNQTMFGVALKYKRFFKTPKCDASIGYNVCLNIKYGNLDSSVVLICTHFMHKKKSN